MMHRKADQITRVLPQKGGRTVRLSTKGRYGLAAMLCLAKHAQDGPVSLRQMGETGIQPDYLEQLLASLRRAGLVTSSRGAQGGYELARPPEEITLREVLNATEGPVRFCDCSVDEDACVRKETCDTRAVFIALSRQLNRMLEGITLAGILQDLPHEGV